MEVVSSEVSIRTGAEQMPAHLARPASGGPWPALVVVMEAFGLNDQIKRITNQFASEGFVAISPNLYFRQLDNVVGYNDLPGAFRLMGSVNDDQIVADMGAAIDHLKAMKEVKPAFGTVGFCMGGRVAFMTACRNPAVRATAPYYGGGIVKSRQPGVKPPIEYVDGLKAPVLAFFRTELQQALWRRPPTWFPKADDDALRLFILDDLLQVGDAAQLLELEGLDRIGLGPVWQPRKHPGQREADPRGASARPHPAQQGSKPGNREGPGNTTHECDAVRLLR